MLKNSTHNKSVRLWRMRQIETIEEFYTKKFGEIREDIRKEIGHFNESTNINFK